MQRREFEPWDDMNSWGGQPSLQQTQDQQLTLQNAAVMSDMMQCQVRGDVMTPGRLLQMPPGLGMSALSRQADAGKYTEPNPTVLAASYPTTAHQMQLEVPGSRVQESSFRTGQQSGLVLQNNPTMPATNFLVPNDSYSWVGMRGQLQPTPTAAPTFSAANPTFQSPSNSQLVAGAPSLGNVLNQPSAPQFNAQNFLGDSANPVQHHPLLQGGHRRPHEDVESWSRQGVTAALSGLGAVGVKTVNNWQSNPVAQSSSSYLQPPTLQPSQVTPLRQQSVQNSSPASAVQFAQATFSSIPTSTAQNISTHPFLHQLFSSGIATDGGSAPAHNEASVGAKRKAKESEEAGSARGQGRRRGGEGEEEERGAGATARGKQGPGLGKCEHGTRKTNCRLCGGAGICEHQRRRSQCKDCGGSAICPHKRIRSQCKDCGGSQICEHNRRRSHCKECGGVAICQHGRQRQQCKDCGGSAFCSHARRKRQCPECQGLADPATRRPRPPLAPRSDGGADVGSGEGEGGGEDRGRQGGRSAFSATHPPPLHRPPLPLSPASSRSPGAVLEGGGGGEGGAGGMSVRGGGDGGGGREQMRRCEHGKRRSQCRACGGAAICEHGKRRSVCRECGGSEVCRHKHRARLCKLCKEERGSEGEEGGGGSREDGSLKPDS